MFRVQVKLGAGSLRLDEVLTICGRLLDGWTKMVQRCFARGPDTTMVLHPVLITTRSMSEAAVDTASAVGVTVWDRAVMAHHLAQFVASFAEMRSVMQYW